MINLCTLTKATQDKLSSLGVDSSVVQKKMDDMAKQANSAFDLLDIPLVKKAVQDFNNALGGVTQGVVGEVSQALATTINESATIVAGLLSVILMVASAGTQVQLLFVSQLKKELSVRITILRLLQYHYQNILKLLSLLQLPRGVSYTKLMLVLPYVRRAAALFDKVSIAQSVNGLPARYSYTALKSAFDNVQIAVNILTSDASQGGKNLGSIIEKAVGGTPTSQQKVSSVAQQIAKELLLKPVLQSLSYLEGLTWNYMRITSMLPIPFEASNALYKPVNYVDQVMKANGITNTSVPVFNPDAADAALSQMKISEINRRNQTLLQNASQLITDVDFLKGLIPTNVLIDSLIKVIIDFPTFNLSLQAATSNMLSFLMPLVNTIDSVRDGMQDAVDQKNDDTTLTAKEGVWTGTLNTLLGLRNGTLMVTQGQAALNQNAYSLNSLVQYLVDHPGSLASSVPDYILQSISVLSAPFSQRSLQESLVLCTSIIKQLNLSIQQDLALLARCLSMSEPLSQFSNLLNSAANLPEPISTIANSLKSGQAQEVLGFISAISLGTMDQLKQLFTGNCPEIKSTEELEFKNSDARIDLIDSYRGVGSGNQTTPSSISTGKFA